MLKIYDFFSKKNRFYLAISFTMKKAVTWEAFKFNLFCLEEKHLNDDKKNEHLKI